MGRTERRATRERARKLLRTERVPRMKVMQMGTKVTPPKTQRKRKKLRRRKSKKQRPVLNSDKFVKKLPLIIKIRCALTCPTFAAGADRVCPAPLVTNGPNCVSWQ